MPLPDATAVATGSGTAGLILALGYVAKLALDYLRGRHNDSTSGASAAVTDAATANSVLLKSLDSETRRADRAEARERVKDQQIEDLKAEIADVRDKLAAMTRQVADMSARLNAFHAE